jgi:hypothetical protein
VHEEVDQQRHPGEQKRRGPGLPVEDDREAAADLQKDGEQQQRQSERNAVEFHISQAACEPGHLEDAGNHEVKPQ